MKNIPFWATGFCWLLLLGVDGWDLALPGAWCLPAAMASVLLVGYDRRGCWPAARPRPPPSRAPRSRACCAAVPRAATCERPLPAGAAR
jgi:hypothetical protein